MRAKWKGLGVPRQQTVPLPDVTVCEVLRAAPDAVMALGADWRVLYLNEAAEQLLTWRAADLIGKVFWDEFAHADDSPFFAELQRAMREGAAVSVTALCEPSSRWLTVQAVPLRHGLSLFFHDVTADKDTEERLRRLASRHASLQTVATAVAKEADSKVVFELVCRLSADFVDAPVGALLRIHADGFEVLAVASTDDVEPPLSGQKRVGADDLVERVRAGESVDSAEVAAGLLGEHGFPCAVLVPVRVGAVVWGCLTVAWREEQPELDEVEPWLREVSEFVSLAVSNTQARGELALRAATDPLTGLANLDTLQSALDRRLAHGQPRGGSVALAVIDVDHFKQVNDGSGHAVGDAVLRAIAVELKAACRDEDLAARIGGDEFALILDRCEAEAAMRIAERVRTRVRRATEAAHLPPVTISVGVSVWEPGLDREAIRRRADDAMYWTKLHGRDATWAYNAELMQNGDVGRRAAALRRSGVAADPVAVERGLREAKTFWQSALDALSKHVAILDETGRIIATNAAWRRFSERNSGDLWRTSDGANYLDVCDAADDPTARQVATWLRELLAGERDEFELDYPCHAPDRERWFTVRGNRFGGDRLQRVIVHHQNITARRIAERQSAFQATLLKFIAVPVFAYNAERQVTYWNGACESLYKRTADEVIGRSIDELGMVEICGSDAQAMRVQLARDGMGTWEIVSVDSSGRRIPTSVTVALVRDANGEPSGVIGTVFDLTERVAHQRDLQAARDFLYMVTNSIGDGLLVINRQGKVAYANTAAQTLLADSTITGLDARTVLYHEAPTVAADELLDQGADLRTSRDTFRRKDGREVLVEWTAASVAVSPDVSDQVAADVEHSRVVVFRDDTERRAREGRLEREAEGLRWAKHLREALDEDRFELHAQPIVSIGTGEAIDHELLIRLRDRDGSLIPPGDFLPAAEEHGLTLDIDCWVTERAVTLAAAGHHVHFNLSARSVGDPDLLAKLRETIRRTDADPRRLTIELTETALLDDRERAAAFILDLKQQGCHIALDDFGAGYNSFARIKDIPADVIKIDRQFVSDLLSNPASESIVKGVLAFAANLRIRVIAEGVEDRETSERLLNLGVQYAQGFYFGRPAPL